MSKAEFEQILARITALETRNVIAPGDDYSDPPLYFMKPDGTPVNPDTFENIPAIVKDLPVFSGDPSELNSWVNDVDSLVRLYQTALNQPVELQNKFHMICKFIRRKIRGEANDALVASNVGINWNLMKKTLITYYGEKRDLETLDFQIMNVQQNGKQLEVYYDEVNRLLSLIANQINTDERFSHPEASRAMIETYNKKAIDAFIRGLDGDIYKFIRNYEPTSLAGAYSYCISFQNIECRKMLTKSKSTTPLATPRNLIPLPPPIPPRQNIRPYRPFQQPSQFQPRNIYPQQTWPQQNFRQPRTPFVPNPPPRNNFGQPRTPFFPNPPQRNNFGQPPPEPMDVDSSIRSRQINYGNRPSFSGNNRPIKRPRVNNIQTQEESPSSTHTPQDQNTSDNIQEQYLPDDMQNQYFSDIQEQYLDNYQDQYDAIPYDDTVETDTAELNFLE